MSRSRKRLPIAGMTICASEKRDKRQANRKLRAAVRGAMAGSRDVIPELREVSDVWTFGKDGKRRVQSNPVEALRK